MTNKKRHKLVIAVDFDGTIVNHEYPKIGTTIEGSFEVLKELQNAGHTLILWTVRCGDLLDEAVNFCANNGLKFYAINNNEPDEEFNKYMSRKIVADYYIDDRTVGGFVGWKKIRETLLPEKIDEENKTPKAAKKNWWKFFM